MPTVKELLYGDAAYTDPSAPTDKELLYSDAGYSFTAQEESAWYDVMGKFAKASQAFDAAVADLRAKAAIAAQHPELAAEYQSLMDRAATMTATMQYIRTAIDDVKAALLGAWSSVTGIWSSIADRVGLGSLAGELGDLEGLPLIPIAAVIAATAILAAFLADYAKFIKRAAMYQSLVASGKSPNDAAAIVANMLPSTSLIGSALGSVPLVVWLGAGAFALWLLFGKKRARA